MKQFPWDTMRYMIDSIPCGDEKVEAIIELNDGRMKVLWLQATATEDDSLYYKRATKYARCADEYFKDMGLAVQ